MQLRYLVCLLAIAAALLPAPPLAAQGIGYSLTPTANFLRWDDELGIRNTYLYGGRLSFDFGPALSLGAYYLTRQGAETDAAAAFPEVPLPDRELDISHFGADMTLSLGTGGFAPFLRGGGGVLRLSPEDGRRTDQVVLKAGGGLRFDLVQGIQGELFAEDWIFRINRYRLFVPGGPNAVLPPDPDFEDLRHNLAVGLGLRIPFGGDTDYETNWLRGAAIPIEPFLGRLQFDDDLALADQNLLGIRTGLDLTRNVGIRGYYWRGMTSDFTDTEPVQSYGGEMQFNLNTGPGISPYLVAGAGQLDFGAGFLDEQEQPQARADETMLILGGGLSLGLSERLRLNVALRDHLLTEGALDDAVRTDDLFHNWLLSAGLTFSIGGTAAPSRMAPSERERLSAEVERLRRENERLRERREAEAEREGRQPDERAREGERREGETARERELREERERERREEQTARERERRAGETTLERELREERERGERLRQEIEELEERTERRRAPERERVQEIRMREGERAITVPLPASGDLVIRYSGTEFQGGERVAREPAAAETGLSRSELRDVIRQELEREGVTRPQAAAAPRAAAPREAEAAVSPAEMREIVRDAVRQELAREGTARTPAPSRAAPARTQAAPAAEAGLSGAEMRELIREVIRQELEREGVTRLEGAAAPPAAAPRAAAPATEPRAAAPALTEERLAQLEQRLAERVDQIAAQRYGAVDPVTRQQTVVVPERSGSAAAAALVTEQRLDLLEQRLMARMDALVERRMREELERQRRLEGVGPAPTTERAVVPRGTAPAAPASVPPPVDPPPTAARVRRPLTLDPERTRAFTGVSFADPQALLGARLNFGPITSSVPLDLVPEVTFGFGDGTSLLLAGNLQYEAGPLTRGTLLTPYVNGGLGLLTSEGLVLNLGYGVSADLGRSALGSVTGFAEHQGIDLYDLHRLLLGVRVRM